jgi:hypothetical protein
MWHTASAERLGIPAIMMTDGPRGQRKHLSENLEHRYQVHSAEADGLVAVSHLSGQPTEYVAAPAARKSGAR